jgi:hypothetical protein
VLGAAEADALRAELPRLRRVDGRVGVRVHLEPAHVVGPLEDQLQVLVEMRRHQGDRPENDAPGAAVDGDHVALGELVPTDRRDAAVVVDLESGTAGDARLAHPACDERRVGGDAAVRREDPGRGNQPVDVVRARLPADEDHILGLPALRGRVRVEDDAAGRGARRGCEARRDDVVRRRRIERRMQEVVELRRVDAGDRLDAAQQALVDHCDRGFHGGRRGPLRGSRLQEVQAAFLDGELDVLHVAVVLLEPLDRPLELDEGVREPPTHLPERDRQADPGDDVLTLSVDEELAAEAALARRRVAAEAHAGATVVTLVPEHHLHHVDGGAEVVRDLVLLAVDACARRVPRLEHGAHGANQLLVGVLRERAPGALQVDLLVPLDQEP